MDSSQMEVFVYEVVCIIFYSYLPFFPLILLIVILSLSSLLV